MTEWWQRLKKWCGGFCREETACPQCLALRRDLLACAERLATCSELLTMHATGEITAARNRLLQQKGQQ